MSNSIIFILYTCEFNCVLDGSLSGFYCFTVWYQNILAVSALNSHYEYNKHFTKIQLLIIMLALKLSKMSRLERANILLLAILLNKEL